MKKGRGLLYYSLLFAVTCIAVYSLHIYYGKSIIYSVDGHGDGLVQHYTALTYYGEWLRSILHNIFIAHRLSIPNWDLSIGLGGDIISTFHYYVIGDPLALLAVLVPPESTEYLYDFLVLLRLYLAGITFWVYCRYHQYSQERILAGAMIYVFSFYSIGVSVLHPFFMNPLIYFPMLLLGIDRIIEKKKPAVFLVFCTIAAYSNFYFFYMMTIFIGIYAVMRYAVFYGGRKKQGIWHFARTFLQLAGSYLIALVAAFPVFLPSVSSVLSGERAGRTVAVDLFYELIYYIKLPLAFVNANADHYAALGYTVVAVVAVGMLFFRTKWREKLPLKLAFLMGTIFVAMPFFGHVFNGFGYAINRWIWAYCFVVSLIVVDRMPQMMQLGKKWQWLIGASVFLLAMPTVYFRVGRDVRKLFVIGILFVCVGIWLLLMQYVGRRIRWKNMPAWTLMTVILANLFLNAFTYYSPYGANDIANHGKFGMAYEERADSFFQLFDEAQIDTSEVRIDTAHMGFEGVQINSALTYDKNSTSFYFSMNNSSTRSFFRDMELPVTTETWYTDVDSRTIVDTALGCRYCVVRKGEERYLPYGYEKLVTEGEEYEIYESKLVLPLVYTYDSYMMREQYDRLTAVQKQQALLQTCALEEVAADGRIKEEKADNLEFTHIRRNYKIDAASEGIVLGENQITVSEPDSFLHITLDSSANAERYAVFKNLHYSGPGKSTITMTDGQVEKSFVIRSPSDVEYADVHDIMCNLGYRMGHSTEYMIYFSGAGVYTYDSMELVDQPMDDLERMVQERGKDSPRYSWAEDELQIEIGLEAPKVIYAAVPYSKKWSAYVDGEPVACCKANGFGIAICIEEGVHQIVLHYGR